MIQNTRRPHSAAAQGTARRSSPSSALAVRRSTSKSRVRRDRAAGQRFKDTYGKHWEGAEGQGRGQRGRRSPRTAGVQNDTSGEAVVYGFYSKRHLAAARRKASEATCTADVDTLRGYGSNILNDGDVFLNEVNNDHLISSPIRALDMTEGLDGLLDDPSTISPRIAQMEEQDSCDDGHRQRNHQLQKQQHQRPRKGVFQGTPRHSGNVPKCLSLSRSTSVGHRRKIPGMQQQQQRSNHSKAQRKSCSSATAQGMSSGTSNNSSTAQRGRTLPSPPVVLTTQRYSTDSATSKVFSVIGIQEKGLCDWVVDMLAAVRHPDYTPGLLAVLEQQAEARRYMEQYGGIYYCGIGAAPVLADIQQRGSKGNRSNLWEETVVPPREEGNLSSGNDIGKYALIEHLESLHWQFEEERAAQELARKEWVKSATASRGNGGPSSSCKRSVTHSNGGENVSRKGVAAAARSERRKSANSGPGNARRVVASAKAAAAAVPSSSSAAAVEAPQRSRTNKTKSPEAYLVSDFFPPSSYSTQIDASVTPPQQLLPLPVPPPIEDLSPTPRAPEHHAARRPLPPRLVAEHIGAPASTANTCNGFFAAAPDGTLLSPGALAAQQVYREQQERERIAAARAQETTREAHGTENSSNDSIAQRTTPTPSKESARSLRTPCGSTSTVAVAHASTTAATPMAWVYDAIYAVPAAGSDGAPQQMGHRYWQGASSIDDEEEQAPMTAHDLMLSSEHSSERSQKQLPLQLWGQLVDLPVPLLDNGVRADAGVNKNTPAAATAAATRLSSYGAHPAEILQPAMEGKHDAEYSMEHEEYGDEKVGSEDAVETPETDAIESEATPPAGSRVVNQSDDDFKLPWDHL